MIPEQNYVAWKVSLTILHLIAICTSVIRVWQRKHTNGMWWDDHLALIPAVMTVIQIVIIWLFFDPNLTNVKMQIALYWLLSFSWFTLIWMCRISLALSIARIFPAWATPRRYSLGLAVCFGIAYFGILSWQATLHCVDDGAPNPLRSCSVDRQNFIMFSVISDVLADIFLIASPFYMLWRIRLPKSQRRLVLTLFSASALTLASAIVFIICNYSPWVNGPGSRIVTSMAAQLEACISVMVCNLLVVVTFFLRMFKKDHADPEAIMDNKVTRHVPPAGGVRRTTTNMNVTVITLTEIAPDVRAKYKTDHDGASTDEGKWSPKSNHMFNVKLPDRDSHA
ncbi:hypothetical protein BDQ17DRAFT_146494 [Cyathus striatus]|nr:hypothetical protein BDQ17DRAFT_146494 [Cyathus striatus]